jgi:hypothetical protein
MSMHAILGFLSAVPLMFAAAGAAPQWLEDGTVLISATVEISKPDQAFGKGGKALDALALETCGEKGKPRQVDEPRLNAMGRTPQGKMQVTLSAIYACDAE